jgi:hypothetical protein
MRGRFFGSQGFGGGILPNNFSFIIYLICCLLLLLLLLQDLLSFQEIVTLRRSLNITDASTVCSCGVHLIYETWR